jgi:hypothetical protein
MMNIFSRREWKKWAYGHVRAQRVVTKANAPDQAPPESEYPDWLAPCLTIGILLLIVIYAAVF